MSKNQEPLTHLQTRLLGTKNPRYVKEPRTPDPDVESGFRRYRLFREDLFLLFEGLHRCILLFEGISIPCGVDLPVG